MKASVVPGRFPLIILWIGILASCQRFEGNPDRIVRALDFDWKFIKADPDGARDPGYDDSRWRSVDIPHDWSIEDLDSISLPDSAEWEGPFHKEAPGSLSTGFTTGGTAWYRKEFTLRREYQGKQLYLMFDGVYMNADVWVNGVHMGNHPYGYTSFWYDITEAAGANNGDVVIAVRVVNEGRNSRWYSGSGIYRHVRLIAVEPIHIAPWGIFAWTASATEEEAIIRVQHRCMNRLDNLSEPMIYVRILDADGHEVAQANRSSMIEAGAESACEFELLVVNPVRWSPERPYLYQIETEVNLGGEPVDRLTTTIGIRTLEFSSRNGFLLNGQNVLLKGACMHHDNGPLGARAYDRAEERRVEIMKANGYNAIRTAHNPPSPAFLEACDRLGMLVIDEAFDHWQVRKNQDDYHNYFYQWWYEDMKSMVFRDRNHPSVIMWSTGNEIMGKHLRETVRLSAALADSLRSLDPTRAVTNAIQVWRLENWDSLARFMDPLDVVGYNYHPEKYVPDHSKYPRRIMYCSESFPSQSFRYWMPVLEHDWVIGDFVWTGYDYLGEASIGWHRFDGDYPWTVAYCGDIDLCGSKRPQSYYRDVLWERGDKVSIFVHNPVPTFVEYGETPWGWDDVHPSWTWEGYEGQELKVDVYSGCEKVRLFLNGQDLGTKVTGKEQEFRASWTVPYQPGELTAVGITGKDSSAVSSLHTVGQPSRIGLSADREAILCDGQDLSYVTVELLDSAGSIHPFADSLIRFEISGPGEIAAVGNANPMSTESFQQNQRTAFLGRCLVVIKSQNSGGRIRLTASGDHLEPSTIVINSKTRL